MAQRKHSTLPAAGPVMVKYSVRLYRQRRISDMTALIDQLNEAVSKVGGVSAATLAEAFNFTGSGGGHYIGCSAEVYLPDTADFRILTPLCEFVSKQRAGATED